MMKIPKFCGMIFIILLTTCAQKDQWTGSPLIVFTFDDCYDSIYNNAFNLMQEYGFVGTNMVCSGRPGNPHYYNWQQLAEMSAAGWEVAGHTVDHVSLCEVPLDVAEWEIVHDLDSLRSKGYDPQGFALPKGYVSQDVFEILRHYYQDIRHSNDTDNYYPVDRTAVGYYPYQSEYTADEPIRRLQLACYRGECIVILGFHNLAAEDSLLVDNCLPSEFRDILEFVSQQGYKVLTMHAALNSCQQ